MNIKVGDTFTYDGKALVNNDYIYITDVGKLLYVTHFDGLKIYFDSKLSKFRGYGKYFLILELKHLIFKPNCKTILPLP